MRHFVTRATLLGSGMILGLIGGALILVPQDFLAMSNVHVEADPGLMSELAAPAGLLLVASAVMLYGAIRVRFVPLALSIGAIVYGSYGAGRVFSILLHGLPSEALISATAIELFIAAVLTGLWFNTAMRQERIPAREQSHAL